MVTLAKNEDLHLINNKTISIQPITLSFLFSQCKFKPNLCLLKLLPTFVSNHELTLSGSMVGNWTSRKLLPPFVDIRRCLQPYWNKITFFQHSKYQLILFQYAVTSYPHWGLPIIHTGVYFLSTLGFISYPHWGGSIKNQCFKRLKHKLKLVIEKINVFGWLNHTQQLRSYGDFQFSQWRKNPRTPCIKKKIFGLSFFSKKLS